MSVASPGFPSDAFYIELDVIDVKHDTAVDVADWILQL